ILVPPLLIALLLGVVALAIVLVVIVALAGTEAFRLLRAAGYPSLALFGTALAIALVVEAAFRAGGDKALLLLAIAAVLAGVGSLLRQDQREGLATWMTTVFGAVYVGLLSFVLRVATSAPPVPAGSALSVLTAEQGWVLLLVLAVWSYDTGAYLVGRQIGRHK